MPKQITAKGKCYACLALVLFIGCLHVRTYTCTYTYMHIVSLNVCASASTLTCLSTWLFPCVAHFMSYSKLVPCRLVAQLLLQAGLDNISEGTWSIFLYARETVWFSSIEACILPTRQQVFTGLEKGKVEKKERRVGNGLLILYLKMLWSIKY